MITTMICSSILFCLVDIEMHFDDVLKNVGEFGRYQKIRIFLICLVSMLCAFHAMNMVFVGASPKKSCHVPDYNLTENLTWKQFEELVTHDKVDEDHLLKKCHMYDGAATIQYMQQNNLSFTDMKRHIERGAKRIPVRKCTFWDFSEEVYGPTIVTEFLLVCDNAWLRSTSKTLYFAGRLVGAVVFGQLSDIVGRRPMFFIGLLLLLVAGCTAAFSPNMYVFVPAYILQGASQTGLFLVAFTMCSEYVGERHRVIATSLMQVFYSFGYMTLSAIAYLIYNWRFIEVAITVPVVFFAFYLCLLPESPRWQLSKNRIDEAKLTMQKMATTNRMDIADDVLDQLKTVSQEQNITTRKTFVDLLRPVQMLRLTINVWFNWLVNSMVYYGLTLGTGYLGGSPYINFMIAGVVELPAFCLCLVLLNRFGRKKPLTGMMLLSATTCIASGFVPKTENLVNLKIALAMISKFGITSSYKIVYLMTAEVFPTVVRNIGMGTSSMTARVGGMLAPQILDLRMYWSPLPSIIFGGLSCLAGILALLLPETKGKPLPQTIEDIVNPQEILNKSPKSIENDTINKVNREMLAEEDTNSPENKREAAIIAMENIIQTNAFGNESPLSTDEFIFVKNNRDQNQEAMDECVLKGDTQTAQPDPISDMNILKVVKHPNQNQSQSLKVTWIHSWYQW
ncbi:hypothetical protein FSP39_019452 [Pinctada imbricata]|uniref:Major facilitator superfamily (MFS) profile domain-containing protein n=1 Tax=Pinctada imbricata TaxID=66713 RepID=A0AA88YFH6_PINIB|nr:hypothetical protein FSP39_019452 [Pinctada imbricata]